MQWRQWHGNLTLLTSLRAEVGTEVSLHGLLNDANPFEPFTLGLIVHDVSRRSKVFHHDQAHKGKVSGVCFGQEGRLLSCGVDRNIKLWNTQSSLEDDELGAGPSQVGTL